MLAELVDHVVGVDPDRDRVTAAVVCARTQGEIDRIEVRACPAGYAELVECGLPREELSLSLMLLPEWFGGIDRTHTACCSQ